MQQKSVNKASRWVASPQTSFGVSAGRLAVGEKPEGVWKQEREHPKSRTCYYLLEKESGNSTSTLSLLLEERSPLVRAENLCKYLPTVRLDPLFVVTQCAAVIT